MKRSVRWSLLLLVVWNALTIAKSQIDWEWQDSSLDSAGLGNLPARPEMACEDYPLSLRCPGRDVIQIETAEYGRQNSYTCSAPLNQMKNTECSLPEAKDTVAKTCNNRTECNFQVSGSKFPDPCPDTHKYLRVTFNCIKFMFGCPGSLVRIGRQQTSAVNVQPQSATWTKDPLYQRDHVFFASSDQTVHEYASWDDFVGGNPADRYNLRSSVAKSNIVVYDRNLYFVKANSRSVVRFSLITRFRTKEVVLPGAGNSRSSLGRDISLAVDESGLWVIYTKGAGVMSISKINKDLLTIEKSWTTTRRMSDSLHAFIICGVLYSVSASSGKIDYSFNTNLESAREKRNLNIAFESPGYGSSRRTSSRHATGRNASFVSYNPRDRLLYSWDSSNANAVYYKLDFDGRDPAKAPSVPTTTSTTTTTTRRTTTRAVRRPVTRKSVQTQPDVVTPMENRPEADSCPSITRGNILWPKTKAGETARMSCSDGTGDDATWECVRQTSMRQADWHVAGPIMKDCITWASDIREKYNRGLIGRAAAFESLAEEAQKREYDLTDKSLRVSIQLIEKLLDDDTLPSNDEAMKMAEFANKLSSTLLNNKVAWQSMNPAKRTELANILMEATEKVGFFYARSVALLPSSRRDDDTLVTVSDAVLMKVEVREKLLHQLSSHSVTSFPNEQACKGVQHCGKDEIKIPDSEIASQMGEGPATVVFALYQNLGEYLSPAANQPWKLDSKIISATFKHVHYQTKLAKPAVVVLQHKQPSSMAHQCVFWDYSQSKKSGNWSSNGCSVKESNMTHTTCECDHLSSFAVLVDSEGVTMSPQHDQTLDIVTKIGIAISIVCLTLCVMTFCCLRNLQNDRNSIHKHFSICLLAAEIIFLVGINQTQNAILCSVVAGALHYFFLAAFLWMALEGFQLYVQLVEVFETETSSRWKWYYLTGYGIPAVIVGVSAGVGHSGYGTDQVCWLDVESGFIWSFLGPIAIIILANLVFLSMTVYKMYVNTMNFADSGKINSIKASVRGSSVLLCLLGITWAFGILWISEGMAVLAYLFCVFNAFQGMFIFISHCLLPRKVRQEYSRCVGRMPCCRNIKADSYVSNSMSFSKQYAPGRYPNGTNGATPQANINQGHVQLRRMWSETVATPRTSQSAPVTADVSHPREAPRGTNCSHRIAGHHTASAPNTNSDQRQRQEDDVFLPPDRELDPRPETVGLLPSPRTEIDYDRLQYYRCPEHYGQANPRSYSPPAHYHPGVSPPQRYPPSQAGMVSPDHEHHRFADPVYHAQPRRPNISPELEYEPTHPQSNRQDPAHPYYWELDPPLGHHHVHQSSLEENHSSGKRDSGISMQQLPPNSMMHRLAHDMRRCDVHRSRDSPLSQSDHGGSNRPTPPIMSPEDENICLHSSRPVYAASQKRPGALSDDDEGQGSSFEDQQNPKMYHNPEPAPRCSHHPQRGVSPQSRLEKPALLTAEQRAHTSIPTDSDDPIVTDCSGSSAGSSFGRQYRSWSNQHEKLV